MSRRTAPALAVAAASGPAPRTAAPREFQGDRLKSPVEGRRNYLINDIFSTFLQQTYEAKIKLPSDSGTRLDNLEVTASHHPGGVGYFQGARPKARALHFDVIDTWQTRRVALMIGDRHG